MPFYFDYDLLLLAVPAVLTAADLMRRMPAPRHGNIANDPSDRPLTIAWPALYCLMLINADIGEAMRLNLAVPTLAVLASLLMARAGRRQVVSAAEEPPAPLLAQAA